MDLSRFRAAPKSVPRCLFGFLDLPCRSEIHHVLNIATVLRRQPQYPLKLLELGIRKSRPRPIAIELGLHVSEE
jgi:hypothetical protein